MKSKLTSILMFFIIMAIIVAAGIIGIIIVQDIFDINIFEPASEQEADYFEGNDSLYTSEDELQIKDQYDSTNGKNTLETLDIPKVKTIKGSTSSSANQMEVNYDNVKVSKFFFNQLNKYSQTIYKALESNKEKMKTGKHQVNLGSTFTDVLSAEDGQKKLGDYFQSAIEAYFYDNPDVFYLSPNKMYLNIETTTRGSKKTYNVFINNGEAASYLIDEFSSKEQVDEAITRVERVRNSLVRKKTSSIYDNLKMVHNYLIDNIEYDSSVTSSNTYDIYGALVNGRCVCEGYAKAFKYILDGMGIESTLVIGKATNSSGKSENHAWNYVKLDGNYYAIDCTWDDPIVVGGTATEKMKYKYFLKGSSVMEQDHTPSGQFTEGGMEFSYPALSYSSYQ